MSAPEAKQRPEGSADLQLYSLATPNGQKITIFLEEAGIPYDAHTIDIRKDTQFEDWFKAINPNSKIPALIDKKGPGGKEIAIFESAAILLYLARKYRKFLPEDPVKALEAEQWLIWQVAGFGPMLGQMNHFFKYAPVDVPYAKERYFKEAARLFGVLEKQLQGKDFVVGELSIADFAIWPWANAAFKSGKLAELGNFPNVLRYIEAIAKRPAVVKGITVNAMS